MTTMMSVLEVSLGVLLVLLVVGGLSYWYIQDITQKKHAILRNYPVIGHLRYFFEQLGEYFRQYFFLGDREEMPFNRATRGWVYRLAKNEGGVLGFGSTYDLHHPGALIFVNAGFPVLEEEQAPTPPLTIGEGYAAKPFTARSIVNISGMSYGALSRPAVLALSKGAAAAGCWMDTGEGGLAPAHLEGGADIIMQIGTAKYGVRDAEGQLSDERLRELAAHDAVKAFEIKLSQGAKPGKGGVLPAAKVTAEIARIRGIPEGVDSISPNRHRDIANVNELLDMIVRVRSVTGKPVGIKTAIGGRRFLHELCEAILRRGLETAPDFIAVDGGEGGSGAAPQALADHMALSIDEALPRVVDTLIEFGLRERIRVIAAGKLVTSARAAWALAAGADFVNTARGFMFSLGCVQAMRCHQNTCPTGISTHNAKLQRGLVVEEKYLRVANYARNMNKEIDMIAHACGLTQAREFRREHVRLVQTAGRSEAFNMIYPYPERIDEVRSLD
ncbi:MAG: FMN-binding glutamate synthase family protein [Zoogloea oleivorans]|jgi:glutamate synthase domain-containing protein 2|uniref:FMN-binding glutamate synthase family protein n=1 Tax=Zoogloea oleivorans TaxID=1552750 RepID=UPI002A36F704|nr:FMN-binding glutamate synthase family protein [Zoogloea oleivorans]MDY0037350.1 FMN-binding glutamate synthase family protein [Zoogloea oleivorans]